MTNLFERDEWTQVHKEWIINIAGKKIPISVLNVNLKFIFIIVSLALCFRIGQEASLLILNMATDSITHSNCYGSYCSSCIPTIGGIGDMDVVINCTVTNRTNSNQSMNSLVHLNATTFVPPG
jgi:hypothetical protein